MAYHLLLTCSHYSVVTPHLYSLVITLSLSLRLDDRFAAVVCLLLEAGYHCGGTLFRLVVLTIGFCFLSTHTLFVSSLVRNEHLHA